MDTLLIILAVLVVIVLIVAFWVMGMYNGLVKLRNRYRNGPAGPARGPRQKTPHRCLP